MRLSKSLAGQIPWYLKPFFWNQKRKYGKALEPAKIWASNPRLFLATSLVYGVLDRKKSPLAPGLRSLIGLRISQLSWCEFCMDLNTANLIKKNISHQKWQDLKNWKTSKEYTEKEKATLHFTEQMCTDGVSNECFQQLKNYFSEKAIVELTAFIAFQIMSCKFNRTLDIKPQGLCDTKISE